MARGTLVGQVSCQAPGCENRIDQYSGGRPRKWCSERCRKQQYRGVCVDCGAPTDGSDGRGNAATRCADCAVAHRHAERRWTPDTVVAAIQTWADEHGRPPTSKEWLHAAPGVHPNATVVLHEHGSWNAAIAAAGFWPCARGCHERPGADPAVVAETVRLYRSGSTTAEVGALMGVHAETVRYRLTRAGVPRRPAHRRARAVA